MSSMFSVSIDTDVDPPVYTVVCDKCGQELPYVPPLTVFKIKGFDQVRARNPERAQQCRDDLAKRMKSTDRVICIDQDNVEIQEIRSGFGETVEAHARTCSR
jgi:ribosomal protein L40E